MARSRPLENDPSPSRLPRSSPDHERYGLPELSITTNRLQSGPIPEPELLAVR